MTCPNCGHQVRDGAKFCDECGVVLPEGAGGTVTPDAPTPVAARPRRLAPPNRTQGSFTVNPIATEGDVPPPPPVDMARSRRIFALVAIVLVAVLCFCCAVAAATLYLLTQNPGSMPFAG